MQTPSKIVVGGFDVIATGSVISYGWQTIDLYPVDNTYHCRLMFEFQLGQVASVFINQLPGNQTQIRLINFDVSTGMAASAPLYVANWQLRKMYLSLACYMLGEGQTGTRVTHFTFHLGETV